MAFRRFVAFIFIVAFFQLAASYNVVAQSVKLQRFAVYFKDKNNNPFSVYNPSAFLSSRALERRGRQSIAIDERDLPITPQYIQGISAAGASVHNVSKWLNAVSIRVADSSALVAITALPYVEKIVLIAKYKAPPAQPSSGIKKPFQLGFISQSLYVDASYGMALPQIDILNGVGLHRKGFTGQGVWIAVFDAGFNSADTHPGLLHIVNSGRLVATRDFVNPGGSVFNSSNHGTQCYSVIGNFAPGMMIGTAPGASFVLCHTEDAGSEMPIEEFNWANAAEYADSLGVDVISSSLGYTTFDDSTLNHIFAQLDGNTTIAAKAADVAASKGIVVVNSAGNNGEKPWYRISTPADGDSVLAVGAVDVNEVVTGFSSRGYSADDDVKPDVMAMGLQTVLANPGNMDYQTGSGTSFAAPAVSGMAACLVQAHPNSSANDIVEAIRASADRYQNPNDDYGYGIPDFQLADLILSDIALQDFNAEATPMIYPNPFRESITVVHHSDISEKGRVEIVDMMGRVQQINDYTIQPGYNQLVSDFIGRPAGMYIIRLITESKSYELKALHQ